MHPLRPLFPLLIVAAVAAAPALAADPAKLLRVSMSDITSLDPQQGTDLM